MSWYIECLKKYAIFDGRARRKEFWMFTLVNSIIIVFSIILDNLCGTQGTGIDRGIIFNIYLILSLLPSIAVSVRRLHDLGKSGWFYCIILIPGIGALMLAIALAKDGIPGENKYGSNPNTSYPNYYTAPPR